MSDREVKTRQTFSEFAKERWGNLDASTYNARLEVWNAALASVILPEGRFEVGQPCEVFDHHKQRWLRGSFGASDGNPVVEDVTFWFDPADVRPLPKTVELTVEEKIDALGSCGLSWRDIAVLTNSGKTLDQLCSEYEVATTKELS